VRDDNGKKVVFLVRADKAERRAVTLGGNRGTDTEVMAGLAVGDAVIVNGPANLHDGESVRIKKKILIKEAAN
jgi:multidrug efflux pump subunit AcrA (membrane-fusion protein)